MKLILLDTLGVPLGALPSFEVEVPWWPEVEEVVSGARRRYGVDIQVLRLLAADGDPLSEEGSRVTYLAQLAMQATRRSTLVVVPTLDLMHQWYAHLLADVAVGAVQWRRLRDDCDHHTGIKCIYL